MAIIVARVGTKPIKVDRSDFDKEEYLQHFIYDNPETVPLYEIKENVRLLVLAKEFPTGSGPIDALGVDADGEIYCIETKLYRNPDKRLVVAQVLDYGASLWRTYRDFGTFVASINEKLGSNGNDLRKRLAEFFGLDDEQVESVLERLRANLLEARFKFVVLMDQLHEQLKDLIVFLNQNSQFDIYAVEVDYYKHQDYEILIPKLYGAEVKKTPGVATSGRRVGKWDEPRFFAEARKHLSDSQFAALDKLYGFSKAEAEIAWGSGVQYGSFSPKVPRISPKSLFTVYTSGQLYINFEWLKGNPTVESYRDRLAQYLTETKKCAIPKDYRKHQVSFEVATWTPAVDDLIAAFRRLLENKQ